jgi:hypothetical protein
MNDNQNNIDECLNPEDGVYIVVEMVDTFNIDGFWFKRRHQYAYLRTEIKEVEDRFNVGFNACNHHVVIVDDTGKEYFIPEHIGVLTKELKSEIQQDIALWMEQYNRDQEKDKTRRNLRELPVWDTEETYSAPFYSGEIEKQRMLKEAGEEDR